MMDLWGTFSQTLITSIAYTLHGEGLWLHVFEGDSMPKHIKHEQNM